MIIVNRLARIVAMRMNKVCVFQRVTLLRIFSIKL